MERRRIIVPLGTALLTAIASASGSGLLIGEAAAQVRRRPDDDEDSEAVLLLAPATTPPELLAHSSHSSHRSHSSHVSGGGGGGGGGGGYSGYAADPSPAPAPPPPLPPPPKPGTVSFLALPGGRISVDGVIIGNDATGTLTLKAGSHEVKVENRFLGNHTVSISVSEGQTGVVEIDW